MNGNTTNSKPKPTAYFSSKQHFTGLQHFHIAYSATMATLLLRTLRPIYAAN